MSTVKLYAPLLQYQMQHSGSVLEGSVSDAHIKCLIVRVTLPQALYVEMLSRAEAVQKLFTDAS